MIIHRWRTTQRTTSWRRSSSDVGNHWRTAMTNYVTDQTEIRTTISDVLFTKSSPSSRWKLSRNEDDHSPWVERHTDHCAKEKPILTNSRSRCCRLRIYGIQTSFANQRPRSDVSWVVTLEKQETNLGAVSYNKIVSEETTSEDREQRHHHSQKSQWWNEVNERDKVRLSKWSTETKNLDDDD